MAKKKTDTQTKLEAAIQAALGKTTRSRSNGKTKYKRKQYDNKKGKRYLTRSSWEFNLMCYLDWLIEKKEIADWLYEPEVFWFEGIKRGVRSYLPDFKITNNDGSTEFWELKGYMDKRSATKIKRMAKYHPKVKLRVIGQKEYNAIKKWSRVIPGWK